MLIGARTGAWSGGKKPVPLEWVDVDWIESDGVGAYINTKVSPNDNLIVDLVFSKSQTSQYRFIFGALSSKTYHLTSAMRFLIGDASTNTFSVENDKKHSIRCSTENGATVDGVNYPFSSTASVASSSYTIFIGARNARGAADGFVKAKFYSITLSDESTNVTLVPVRHSVTNEGAMRCVETGEIFHNAGTGAFVIGPDRT